ncbi:CamS family sex pheromone protein [Alkalicoccus luteus]|uniref:CamS family sex pheromone protein n=1 Tax=Alkalicoccus luteus TaxID=1237094 RepID=UPI004034EC1A
MKKKLLLTGSASLFLLAGCMPSLDQTEEEVIVVEETEEEEEQEYVITPTIDSPDSYYRNVLEDGTYQRSEARGSVADAMNNRVDIEHFELGLMEIASGIYDQENYFFQEGTHLPSDLINSWLRRFEPEQTDEDGENDTDVEDEEASDEAVEIDEMAGLNPPLGDEGDVENADDLEDWEVMEERMRSNPLVLSNIKEQNYYVGSEEEGVRLGGMVIGISVRSVYYFRTENDEGGIFNHEEPVDEEFALDYAEEQAQEMLTRLRNQEELADVPITFAVFREEPRGSIVPGEFRQMATVGEGETEIGGWEAISETNLVFPSSEAREQQPQLSENFLSFRDELEDFFDMPLGIVGKGRYKDQSLDEFKVEINLQSHGKAEIIALTQFISSRVGQAFQMQAPIYIYIDSVEGREAVVIQYPDEDPFMHVYR